MREPLLLRDAIAPHGGILVDRRATTREAEEILREAPRLQSIRLSTRQRSDLFLIASGAYSPLGGFMGREDLASVWGEARRASGQVWPLPVVLSATPGGAGRYRPGERLALLDHDESVLGILDLKEKFEWDRRHYADRVFSTTDMRHPGVRRLMEGENCYLAGPVKTIARAADAAFPQYHRDPAHTRRAIRQKGWRTVVGFQTRNPIHRAHEFILKSALEIFDALLIHPLVGETRSGDIPADVRMRCYQVLLDGYYPPERTLLAVLPAAMRFAGPREALFHALVRKNYGCTHFIVGRDHAGIGGFYDPLDAQRIFGEFDPAEIGIVPLFFEAAFFCARCGSMASRKTCPHSADHHITLSGTELREMLSRRERPPIEFTRPEVAQVLMEHTEAQGT